MQCYYSAMAQQNNHEDLNLFYMEKQQIWTHPLYTGSVISTCSGSVFPITSVDKKWHCQMTAEELTFPNEAACLNCTFTMHINFC